MQPLARALILISFICLTAQRIYAAPLTAEATVERYCSELYAQHWDAAASYFDPDSLKRLQNVVVHIAETTDDPKELKQFLSSLEVVSIDEFRKLPPRTSFSRFLACAWSLYSQTTKDWWSASKVHVIGSVMEGDLIHVVCRTFTKLPETDLSVVSVATAKKVGDTYLIITTAEFEATIRKFKK
jgi:hypothetical protein